MMSNSKALVWAGLQRAVAWAYAFASHHPTGLRILMYHAIGTSIDGDRRGLYTIDSRRFLEHMSVLAGQYSSSLVTFDATVPESNHLKIAVTFDDGYEDNLSVAAPILCRLGIPFTVFVQTGAVAANRRGYLNVSQLRELASCPGATIGSHTVSHPHLADVCDNVALDSELRDSKAYLEDILDRRVDLLSYPNGSTDLRVRAAAHRAGYRIAGTSWFNINRPGRDPLLLGRSEIWGCDDTDVLVAKIRGDWDWMRWRRTDPARLPGCVKPGSP